MLELKPAQVLELLVPIQQLQPLEGQELLRALEQALLPALTQKLQLLEVQELQP